MAKLFGSYLALLSISSLCFLGVSAQQCSEETLCPNNQCCSIWGYCGTSYDHCCDHCLSQCTCNIRRPARNGVGVEGIVNEFMFNKMLPDRDSSPCVGHFYSYRAFREGAARFPEFGTTGDEETRKREVAAFLAQTSHATTGGSELGPVASYTRGYCWTREERNADPSTLPSYCEKSEKWPCASGKKYYGRGPIQLTHNYNYGPAGEALGYDLLNYPEGVELDPYVAFETAFWFWMTPHPPKPSCHDVMTGNFTPAEADVAAGRVAGFGLCTNIINGGEECGGRFSYHGLDRLGFYMRYCQLLGVDEGENTDCGGMQAYPDGHRSEGAGAGGGAVRSQ